MLKVIVRTVDGDFISELTAMEKWIIDRFIGHVIIDSETKYDIEVLEWDFDKWLKIEYKY